MRVQSSDLELRLGAWRLVYRRLTLFKIYTYSEGRMRPEGVAAQRGGGLLLGEAASGDGQDDSHRRGWVSSMRNVELLPIGAASSGDVQK